MNILASITHAERQLRDARDKIESLHRDAERLRKTRDAANSGAAVEIRCTSHSRDEAHIFHCRDLETRALVARLLTAAVADAEDRIMRVEAEIAGRFPGLAG